MLNIFSSLNKKYYLVEAIIPKRKGVKIKEALRDQYF